MRKRRKVWILLIFLFLLLPVRSLLAQLDQKILEGEDYLNELGRDTEVLERGNLIKIIFDVIRYLLGFLGVAAVIVIIVGGYTWMTAAGNEENVKKAKQILQSGLIGLVIILIAYVLVIFVTKIIRGEV